MLDYLQSIDTRLFLFINRDIANTILDGFFPAITEQGFWTMPLLIVAAYSVYRYRRRSLAALLLAGATVAITDPLCCRVLKELFLRHRPCDPCCLVPGGRFLWEYATSWSFPSAHAMNFFGAATVLSFHFPRQTVWFVVPASLVAISRVYVGVHYPFDVLAGAVFGTAIGTGVSLGYRRIMRLFPDRTTGTPSPS